MNFGIKHKLFFTLFLTSSIVVVSMYLFMQWSFTRGFTDYVNTQELQSLDNLAGNLVDYYQAEGNWNAMVDNHHLWMSIQKKSAPKEMRQDPRPGPRPRPGAERKIRDPFRIGPRTALVDADRQTLLFGRHVKELKQLTLRPLEVDGKTIGYLGLVKPSGFADGADVIFVEQQTRTFALIAITMILISMALGLPLINHLLVPIKSLTKGADRLTSGEYSTRIPIAAKDELGQLSHDFNTLAATLEKNETSRQQWMADISHELRTPLAILRGEIEAIQDGVRSADEQTLAALHGEILRLNHLVGDLHELSMSDLGALSYRKQKIDPVIALEQTVELFSPRMAEQNISLVADLPEDGTITLSADSHRLQQLFNNLLENSLRYTDPNGRVEIGLEMTFKSLKLVIQDSAPGVSDAQRPKLFDRLYRVDASRNRAKGGSGLGLAICKNIVEAHGGRIEALPSSLGGLLIEITLPT